MIQPSSEWEWLAVASSAANEAVLIYRAEARTGKPPGDRETITGFADRARQIMRDISDLMRDDHQWRQSDAENAFQENDVRVELFGDLSP